MTSSGRRPVPGLCFAYMHRTHDNVSNKPGGLQDEGVSCRDCRPGDPVSWVIQKQESQMSTATSTSMFRVLLCVVCSMVVVSCTGMHESPDFDRHRFSQLKIIPDRDDLFFFDVMVNAGYPADDPAAEALRMKWLGAWLQTRRMCPRGFTVLRRRKFRFLEDNPGRYDFRYEVTCKSSVAPGG